MGWLAGQTASAGALNDVTVQVAASTGLSGLVPVAGTPAYVSDLALDASYSGFNWLYGVAQLAPTQVLGATTGSVGFSSIPAVTRLVLEWRVRAAASGQVALQMQVDANSGSHYLWSNMQNSSNTIAGFHSGALTTQMQIGSVDGNTAGFFGNGRVLIDGWNQATGYLTANATSINFSTATTDVSGLLGGLFAVVGPHSSLTIFLASGSFAAGSQFTLYGEM